MSRRKPNVKIEFAVVSVKAGRRSISKTIGDHRGDGSIVPVTLTGYISYAWGSDDGIDQEFAMVVESAVIGDPVDRAGRP